MWVECCEFAVGCKSVGFDDFYHSQFSVGCKFVICDDLYYSKHEKELFVWELYCQNDKTVSLQTVLGRVLV